MRYVAVLTLLLFTSGCAGEPDVYAIVQDRAYSPSEFKFASQHKEFPTVFAGDLFSLPRRQVRSEILSAMQPENWWFSKAFTPRTEFTDNPTGRDTAYRITVSLNPSTNGAPASYCQLQDSPPGTEAPETSEITVRMAFCRDDTLLSTSRGSVANVDGPTDPRFRKMITRMTMALFPQRRDNDRGCGPLNRNRSC